MQVKIYDSSAYSVFYFFMKHNQFYYILRGISFQKLIKLLVFISRFENDNDEWIA